MLLKKKTFFMKTFFSYRYTNAETKTYQYLILDIKMVCRKFLITALFTFQIYAHKIYKMLVYKHIETIKYVKK